MTTTTPAPIDWIALAEQAGPFYPDIPDDWQGYHSYAQVHRALWHMIERLDSSDPETLARRTAVILNADPAAPELERMLGIRLAVDLEGQNVKCQGCRRKWVCLPEDPYYDAVNAASGLCGTCMLAETRTDAAVPVLEGQVIEPGAVVKPITSRPTRPRRRKTASSEAQEAST